MKIKKTDWKHLAIGWPILFVIGNILLYLIKCISE